MGTIQTYDSTKYTKLITDLKLKVKNVELTITKVNKGERLVS